MSSLRPLATIALLAAVGVFLYMKINESEPKLSPELEEWSTSTLDIGDPSQVAEAPAAKSSAADVSAPPAAGDEAPPFASAQLNPPAAAHQSPPGDEAPAWNPSAAGTARSTDEGPAEDSSPIARSADVTPAVPAIPPLPVDDESAKDAAASAVADAAASVSPAPSAEKAELDSQIAGTSAPTTPTPTTSASSTPKPSMFAAARVAAQGALDRGELAQALGILSEWYGDPSLTPAESKEVNDLLSQLAGSVIYEGPPAHRLLPAHIVSAGETLESIAAKYDVPWQLLAKINGISDPNSLVAGQPLKVVPGPFSARIDLSERMMTLMLDRRYAGRFPLEFDPAASVEEGEWKVDQKLLTPAGAMYGAASGQTEDRSLLLANLANPAGQPALVRGPGDPDPVSASPRDRVLRLKAVDVADVFDILSEGSRVTITR